MFKQLDVVSKGPKKLEVVLQVSVVDHLHPKSGSGSRPGSKRESGSKDPHLEKVDLDPDLD